MGLTERSMKEHLHIVNLITMEEVICLNLGKSRSKLFKEITHIFETISGVIKIEIMYMGPIVVQKLNLNILIEAVLVPGLIYAYE